MEAVMDLCAPPASPAEVDSITDATVKVEEMEEPTPVQPTRKPKKAMKKKQGRKSTQAKSEPTDIVGTASGVHEPPSKKRKRTKRAVAVPNVRTDTRQEDYDEEWYEEAEWDQGWTETEAAQQWQQSGEVKYPWGLWTLMRTSNLKRILI